MSQGVVEISDEIQVAQAFFHATNTFPHFIQAEEYFPVTRRQMKQSWRSVRSTLREGPCRELDLEETVHAIGRQGIFLEPVLVPERINSIELFLLLDQGGSMTPFHAFSTRLTETALRGGRLGQISPYYFRNCPIEYLYTDSAQIRAVSLNDFMDCLHTRRTSILFFSDAGAARGRLSEKRVEMTAAFLYQIRQYVQRIVWLNPMPRSRWSATSAEKIRAFVPMFDLSRSGLDDAMGILRGRSVCGTNRGRED